MRRATSSADLLLGGRAAARLGGQGFGQRADLFGDTRVLRLQFGQRRLRGFQFLDPAGEITHLDIVRLDLRVQPLLLLGEFIAQLFLRLRAPGQFLFEFSAAGDEFGRCCSAVARRPDSAARDSVNERTCSVTPVCCAFSSASAACAASSSLIRPVKLPTSTLCVWTCASSRCCCCGEFIAQLFLRLRAPGQFLFEFSAAGDEFGRLLLGGRAAARLGGQGFGQRADLFGDTRVLRLQFGQRRLRGFQFLDPAGEITHLDIVRLDLRVQPLLLLGEFIAQLFLRLRAPGQFLFEFSAAGDEFGRLLLGGRAAARLGGQGFGQRADLFGDTRVLRLQFGQRRLRGFQFLDPAGEITHLDIVRLDLRVQPLLLLGEFIAQLFLRLRAPGQFLFEFSAAGDEFGRLLLGGRAAARLGGQGFGQRADLFGDTRVLRLQFGQRRLRGFQFLDPAGEITHLDIVRLDLRVQPLLLLGEFIAQLFLRLRAPGQFLFEFSAAGDEFGRLLLGGRAAARLGGQGFGQRADLFGDTRVLRLQFGQRRLRGFQFLDPAGEITHLDIVRLDLRVQPLLLLGEFIAQLFLRLRAPGQFLFEFSAAGDEFGRSAARRSRGGPTRRPGIRSTSGPVR